MISHAIAQIARHIHKLLYIQLYIYYLIIFLENTYKDKLLSILFYHVPPSPI